MKVKTLLFLSTLVLSTAAYSHDFQSRHDFNKRYARDLKTKINNFKARPELIQKFRNFFKPKKLTTVACGDVITESITIANNLNCPEISGYALQVVGDNISVNANGKKISAPNAAAGLFVQGDNNTITNFDIQGVTEGHGMMAYNSSNLKVVSNNFSKNRIGIMIYADEVVKNPIVMANRASHNSFAGVEMFYDEPGSIQNPIITLNDFKSSGEFAVYLKADKVNLQYTVNDLSGSSSGFYLTGGDFKVEDLSLTNQLIHKRHFMVDSVSSIIFKDMNLTSIAPMTANQDRIAIDMYRVEKFTLDNVSLKNHDVGLKVATDGDVATQGLVKDSLFSGQSFAGLYMVSWDSTELGTIKVLDSEFKSSAYGIVVAEGTVVDLLQLKTPTRR